MPWLLYLGRQLQYHPQANVGIQETERGFNSKKATNPGLMKLSNNGHRVNRGEKQALVRAIPFCGECTGPRFEDKFRSANQMEEISIAERGKMADS